MRITDLYTTSEPTNEIEILGTRCAQFFCEADNQPLLKNLSVNYGDLHKVKVRKRKAEQTEFADTFNEAFELQHPGLRQRAIFANGKSSFQPIVNDSIEPFYVFPVDGYKFIYSREVQNSGHEYKHIFETLFEQFGEEKGNAVATDLLRFTYTSKSLCEGIETGCEIIIYGIPYFYAVRVSSVTDYDDLLSRAQA